MIQTEKHDSEGDLQKAKKTQPKERRHRIFSQCAKIIQFIAIVVGMAAVIHEIKIQLPKDRNLRDVHLHATIATLATVEDADLARHSIQKIMELMHKDGDDDVMKGMFVPAVTFFMADFEGINLSDAYMEDVGFTCTDQVFDEMDDNSNDTDDKEEPCASLQKATFSGSMMDGVEFQYANLHEANFYNSRLDEIHIENSILSKSDFSKARIRGIQIESSDFTDANFGQSIKFDCKRRYDSEGYRDRKCASLKRVDFSAAKMSGARFYGADISKVNFVGSNLKKARFVCDEVKGKKTCSSMEGVCFQGAKLDRAKFEGVTIKNSDFSAEDMSRARFKGVKFENVIFPDAQVNSAKFDRSSLDSLNKARSTDLGLEDDETPCSQAWRQELTEWKEKFVFRL